MKKLILVMFLFACCGAKEGELIKVGQVWEYCPEDPFRECSKTQILNI